ncbi:hypothetical protein [Streptococcus pneumoniae]|uniref:hypothetical protein n=1 Tax=Streptococcus pneumoniae TaxID=1313 RepID=UPI00214D9C67|nr:hypothetical protein [Streptococcus pneumoniae]
MLEITLKSSYQFVHILFQSTIYIPSTMHHNLGNSYSIKIKKQTRKLAAGCSKHRFEVADRTHCFEVVDETEVASNHTHDKPTLTWFEEIFEEYHSPFHN